MIKKILFFNVCLTVIFLLAVSLQPSEYRIEKSIEISARPSNVFFHVSDLKEWPRWSPWAAKDLDMEMEYSPNTNSVGSYLMWKSVSEGEGKQIITRTEKDSKLNIDLEFYKPAVGTAVSDFTLTPTENGTKLTWGINSKNSNFADKFFYLALGVEDTISKDFESGLATIKELAEN